MSTETVRGKQSKNVAVARAWKETEIVEPNLFTQATTKGDADDGPVNSSMGVLPSLTHETSPSTLLYTSLHPNPPIKSF